ncbi:hypothetical protein Tco_1263127 [Tanacetum coccineum]
MESCDPVGTPMEIKDKLDLDQNRSPDDATKYRSMIGALMYLTSSRPNILHATCLCARYQAKTTEKHLKEVKRIFRYLRGTVNTGLWYMKDSGFELTGFLDADYAGCKDTFKSTSGGAHFLGENMLDGGLLNMQFRDRVQMLGTPYCGERMVRIGFERLGTIYGASDLARSEVMSLCTTVLGQQIEIAALRATDRVDRQRLQLCGQPNALAGQVIEALETANEYYRPK